MPVIRQGYRDVSARVDDNLPSCILYRVSCEITLLTLHIVRDEMWLIVRIYGQLTTVRPTGDSGWSFLE